MKPLTCALSSFLCFGLVTGCGGGSTPQPDTPSDVGEAEQGTPRERTMTASSEVGALDEGAVTRTFEGALPALEKCLHEGASRVELLGGQIAFYVEIDAAGGVQHVHAEQSTLGDRETERCMLDVLKQSDWPRPQGGEKGLARNSFDFDMPNDVRPPVDWDSSEVADALNDVSDQIEQCKSGSSAVMATVYVDTEGQAIAAGVAGTDPETERSADCIADVLKQATYPSPGSWPAKVTFSL